MNSLFLCFTSSDPIHPNAKPFCSYMLVQSYYSFEIRKITPLERAYFCLLSYFQSYVNCFMSCTVARYS